jgi:hypothetical protein
VVEGLGKRWCRQYDASFFNQVGAYGLHVQKNLVDENDQNMSGNKWFEARDQQFS